MLIQMQIKDRDQDGLKNILKRNGMPYLVKFPTRLCNTTETAIDNVLTNILKKHIKVEGIITSARS